MKTRELRAKYAAQESFYKKAFVREDEEGTEYLYSAYRLIVTNYGQALKFEENGKLYSHTTMRHLREYLKQIGKWELATMPKSKLLKRLERTNYIILDIL